MNPTSIHPTYEGGRAYLGRGEDRGGNVYADPTRSCQELLAKRGMFGSYRNAH